MLKNKKCKDCCVKTDTSSFGFCLKCHIKNKLCMNCGDGPFITLDENNLVYCSKCIKRRGLYTLVTFL